MKNKRFRKIYSSTYDDWFTVIFSTSLLFTIFLCFQVLGVMKLAEISEWPVSYIVFFSVILLLTFIFGSSVYFQNRQVEYEEVK